MSMTEDLKHVTKSVFKYSMPGPNNEPPKHIIMQPWQYRLLLIEGVKSGHLDY